MSRMALPICLAAVLLAHPAAYAQDVEAIVDAQGAAAGKPPGVRASNAKGMCVRGLFTPSAEAAAMSKAPIFAQPTPLIARFAMGGGNPRIADTVKGATRGFSMKFEYAGGETSLLFISAPMFVANTPDQMLAFITVRLPGPNGQPDAAKVKAFSDANPNTLRQGAWLAARPIPASFAGVNYWAVQAYTLTNAKNEATVVKLRTVPKAGDLTLTDDEVKAKPPNFYAEELATRLRTGPAAFDLVATILQPGDVTNDSTVATPDGRKEATLGAIAIAEIIDNGICDAGTFDPVMVPEGMAGPADDPLFEIRSLAYAISLSRRQ